MYQDPRRSHHPGGAGRLRLPAESAFDLHPGTLDYRLPGRDLRLPVCRGIQPQHADALCAGAGHRYGGR